MPQAAQDSETDSEPLAELGRVCLHIHASLDPTEVLQAVAGAAHSLSGARYAVVCAVDEAKHIHDWASAGFSPDERQRLAETPSGQRFLESLVPATGPEPDDYSEPSPDIQAMSEVCQSLPRSSWLSTAIQSGDRCVGWIWLAQEEAVSEFSRLDNQRAEMLAAQAAAAITNARCYSQERRAKADLLALIDTSPIGVIVFDAEAGLPISVNQEALRIARGLRMPERSLEELAEVLICRRADGREIALSELPLAQSLSTGETVRAEEIVLETPDGRSITVLVNATPIRSDAGVIESVVVTLQDLTTLEQVERLRAEFLGMVSHELRTPLTSIKGSTTTMLNGSAELDPVEARRFIEIIDEQADRMHGLISQLLDLARIEAGTLSVDLESGGLAALADEARNLFLNGGGSQRIEVDLGMDLPKVRADRRRIVQVLSNLFANAAEHSESASVIRVAAKAEGDRVVVCVSDDGLGVEPQRLPELFRKFSQLDFNDGEDEWQGSGLGLAICKGIVEAHGGRIWAESGSPEPGTQFKFTLTIADEFNERDRPDPSSAPGPSLSEHAPVLVVDDDPHALAFLRTALTSQGYTAIVTAEPDDALRLVRERQPALVLLDLVFPGADGIELMGEILDVANLPVIFVSGYGRDEIIARALDEGASDYLVKPFSPTELGARIRSALRDRQAIESAEQRPPYRCGDLRIDYQARRVTVAGNAVKLAPTEYELLVELSLHAGRVVTHELLLQRVWGLSDGSDARFVRAAVKRLRRKLGDDADHPRYVFTEPRVGYRLAQADESVAVTH